MAAILGPLLLTILYLVAASVARDVTGAEGYARATLDITMYVGYAIVMGLFVLVGTWKSRGSKARVLFAIVSSVVSLFAMFIAFFGQMAP